MLWLLAISKDITLTVCFGQHGFLARIFQSNSGVIHEYPDYPLHALKYLFFWNRISWAFGAFYTGLPFLTRFLYFAPFFWITLYFVPKCTRSSLLFSMMSIPALSHSLDQLVDKIAFMTGFYKFLSVQIFTTYNFLQPPNDSDFTPCLVGRRLTHALFF